MSHPFLALEGVTQVLADGRILFSGSLAIRVELT